VNALRLLTYLGTLPISVIYLGTMFLSTLPYLRYQVSIGTEYSLQWDDARIAADGATTPDDSPIRKGTR